MTTSTPAHAKKSASGSERWINCPGSIALCEKAPPSRTSPYAEEGTRAHGVLEKILKSFITPKGRPYSTAKMLEGTYPEEMVRHALDAFKEIERRIPGEMPGVEILCETKVSLSFIAPHMFGTVDAAIVEVFGRLTVIDYKYGAGVPVDPEDNPQLLYYALALAHQYDYNFSEICILILQPRAEHERGPYREWVTTVEKLKEWAAIFKRASDACDDPMADLKAGKWCRWCPAAPICPEISERAIREAQADFEPATGALALPVAATIQVAHLAKILPALDKIENWIGELRAHAFHVLERGEKIPGYKLVEKRGIRKWYDEDEVRKAMKAWGPLVFKPAELKSPAQMEKLDGAQSIVDKYSKAVSSGLTLATEDDKRPAINQIEADFAPITEEGDDDMAKKKAKKKTKKSKK